MAKPTSQDKDPLGNKPLSNDLQDDSQNTPTVFDLPQVQGSTSNFEHCFTDIYSFQTSVMSNLNRLDFKNLQLAGVKTPISQQARKKNLIPSKCDEKLKSDKFDKKSCSNTTQTVKEIKACQGMHWDDEAEWEGGQPEKWIEPIHYKHIDASNTGMKTTNGDGGNFDSFNVCIHCHDRRRWLRRSYQISKISSFHSTMCRSHCLEYIQQQPYNTCHCDMFIEDYWRCNECSAYTLATLCNRALKFGYDPLPRPTMERLATRHDMKCPIRDCIGDPWISGPSEQQMWLCRACTGIFPSISRTSAN